MNSKQTTVMWMGLLLVALRFFTNGQFKAVWHTILQKDPGQPAGNAEIGPNGQPANPLYPLLGPKYINSTTSISSPGTYTFQV